MVKLDIFILAMRAKFIQFLVFPLREIASDWSSIFNHEKAKQWIAKCDSDHVDCLNARSIRGLNLP